MPVEPEREPLSGQTQATDPAFARLIGLAGLSAETRRRNQTVSRAKLTASATATAGQSAADVAKVKLKP